MPSTRNQSSRTPSTNGTVPSPGGRKRYLIAPRTGSALAAAGLHPISANQFQGLVNTIPDIEIVNVIRPRCAAAPGGNGTDPAIETLVARLDEEQVAQLRQAAPAHLIVEEDAYLGFAAPAASVSDEPDVNVKNADAGLETRTFRFKILGDGDRALTGAAVEVRGEGLPVRGLTDGKGEIALEIPTCPDERPRSVFVAAPHGHWTHFVLEPDVQEGKTNTIRLQSLEESYQGFPEHYHYGWGARLMGLDRLDRSLTGRGVKVAIIDSGVDNGHPLLRHVQQGADLSNDEDASTWCDDQSGHGSHCAGIIAARGEGGLSLRGFAPDAEIHAFKVVPGARISDLIEALDLCIQRGIDVVNISLACEQFSWTVEQKLEECVLNGIACIAAAGSTGGAVQYPAASPWTFAVSAIGKIDEVPATSWERNTVAPTQVAPTGLFAPVFGCTGPELAFCAPGVGVVSTAPGGAFAARSGSSVAAPHVTGLAALILAHHPWFNGLPTRNHERVQALFQVIGSTCVPCGLHPWQTGAGVPRIDHLPPTP